MCRRFDGVKTQILDLLIYIDGTWNIQLLCDHWSCSIGKQPYVYFTELRSTYARTWANLHICVFTNICTYNIVSGGTAHYYLLSFIFIPITSEMSNSFVKLMWHMNRAAFDLLRSINICESHDSTRTSICGICVAVEVKFIAKSIIEFARRTCTVSTWDTRVRSCCCCCR